jgi:hypothetical protein
MRAASRASVYTALARRRAAGGDVAGGRMAARQLPHHLGRLARHPHDLPPSFFRRLPRVATDEFAGFPRIYALALELIGSSAGRLDAQRLQRFISAFQSVTPLTMGELWAWPSALKLALLDHLRARGDVLAATRAHRLAADRLAALDRGGPVEAGEWPAQIHHAFVTRLLQRSRALGAAASGLHHSSRRRWRRGARRSRTRFARRAAPGGRAGGHGEPDRQPPPDLDVRLERVLREREPRRAGAAARSGRRLRPDGLPQPRPLSPRRRGAGGADRRRAAAARAEERRACAAGSRADPRGARGARRLPPDRGAGRRQFERSVAWRPSSSSACGGSSSRGPPRLPRRHRGGHGAARRPAVWYAWWYGWRGAALLVASRCWRRCRRASWPSSCCSG